MKITKLTQLYFCLTIIVLTHIASSTSFGGRNNNTACGGCHGPGNSGMMMLTGLPTTATAGITYNGQICIVDPVNNSGMANGGFRLDISQGTYSNLGVGVRTGGGGLTHNMPKSVSGGQFCWTFDWTAPASGNSNLQLYGNAANGDGDNTNADQGGYQMFAVIPTVNPCATDLVITDNPIPTGTYESSNSITAMTPLASTSTVVFDTPNCINLQANFEVPLGADFETTVGTTQGCFTNPNPVTNVFYDTKEWIKTE